MRFTGLHNALVAWGMVLCVPLLMFAALMGQPQLDLVLTLPAQHFYVVSTVSLVLLLFAFILLFAAARLDDRRMEWMALGFLTLAGIFAVHGLATPGFLVPKPTAAVGVSARLSFFGSALLFAASALNLRRRPGRWLVERYHWPRFGVPILVIAYLVIGVTIPGWLAVVPTGDLGFSQVLTLVTVCLFAFAASRFARDYTLARLPMQSAFVFGLLLLADSVLIVHIGEVWRLSW